MNAVIDTASPSEAEVDADENWLLTLATRTDHRLRLPNAMRLARQAGHNWRAVVAARRRQGIPATRDSDGEWDLVAAQG
jgi:hypothetical protein